VKPCTADNTAVPASDSSLVSLTLSRVSFYHPAHKPPGFEQSGVPRMTAETPLPFRPTRPPPERLARIGVVLDTRAPWGRFAQLARICDEAGIDAVWVGEHTESSSEPDRLDPWTALSLASREAQGARLGAMFRVTRTAAQMATMAATLDAASGGRLELTLRATHGKRGPAGFQDDEEPIDAPTRRLRAYAQSLRKLLGPGLPLAIEATSTAALRIAARVADDVLVPATRSADLHTLVDAINNACQRAGRDPTSLGVAMELPVSIGRTTAEAQFRAETETLFTVVGQPRDAGIFGTLEQCQERVQALAHAGVTDLRCVVPNSADVHDVIAQLTAIAVGTIDVFVPGAPRSKAPDPPPSWGGRRSAP
jgi:alkanesulfonate monooxygenase SsuD/methylene tetrahydromethanopterin reductase-like flavin-dependent oxidoreductase (luciferase family)